MRQLLGDVRDQQGAEARDLALGRGVAAVDADETDLAATGAVEARHHSYTLEPRSRLVDDRQIARCLRHNHKALDVTAAAVLQGALTRPREERAVKLSATPQSARQPND